MLQNEQSKSHLLYSMTLVVVLFAYPVKLNIMTRNAGFTNYTVILSDLPNASIKMLGKISFHKYFKSNNIIVVEISFVFSG